MALRRGDHRLQAPARALLRLGRLGDRRAGGGEVGAQRVADGLERGEPEQARPTGHDPRAPGGRRAVDDRVGQLALEAGDLRAQVGARRDASVLLDVREAGGRHGCGERAHRQPPIGARGLAPQKTWVPSIPMRWTITMLRTIDFAVAVPTPTGPPDAW